jgi:hypothetical protein
MVLLRLGLASWNQKELGTDHPYIYLEEEFSLLPNP